MMQMQSLNSRAKGNSFCVTFNPLNFYYTSSLYTARLYYSPRSGNKHGVLWVNPIYFTLAACSAVFLWPGHKMG